MNKVLIACVGLVGVLLVAAPAPATAQSVQAASHGVVQNLAAGQYAQVTAQFDATMKSAISTEQLAEVWQGLVQQIGPFQTVVSVRTQQAQGMDVAVVNCRFASGSADVQVAWNAARQISGLYITPAAQAPPAPAPAPGPAPPTPQPPASSEARELQVTVGAKDWPLSGTLSIPAGRGPFPAVVLVHGSGPNDRDETIGPNKPFKDIADGLAKSGIATLRYEKRTKQHADRVASQIQTFTVREEFIDDAVAAVKFLQARDEVRKDKVFVLGHSQGGMVAPRIADLAPGTAGVILLAANARPMDELLLEQLQYLHGLDGEVTAEETSELANIRARAERIADESRPEASSAQEYLLGIPDHYWRQLRKYQPLEVAKALKMPMLILHGGRDYQVSETDYNMWRSALGDRPNVTLNLFPDLNHLFMKGEGKGTPSEYEQPGQVAPQVIAQIAQWVKSH